jgi:hypothetical protein
MTVTCKLSSVAQYPSALTVYPCSRISPNSILNKSHKASRRRHLCHFKPLSLNNL